MKKLLYSTLGALCLLVAYACGDSNVGFSIVDTESTIIIDSSFVVTGVTVPNHKVHARTSTQLVGEVTSAGYGSVYSDVVCQLMPALKIDTTGTQEDWIDSCRITLCIAAENGFTGDSLAPMRVSVYELTKQLPDVIYSDFSPEGYYDPANPLGEVACSPKSAEYCSETLTSGTSYWREIHIPVPVEYARKMFRLWNQDSEIFKDPNTFKQYFPGLYITHSYGSGRVMNYYSTGLEVFYRQHVQLTDTTDTIQTSSQVYVASTPEVITNNNIRLNPDPIVTEMIDAGDAIVMGPAGYKVNVRFPIQDIIDKYKRNTANGLSLINSLELRIPVESVSNEYDVAPPQYILMVKKDKEDEFFAGDSLTNDENSFYATYDATNKEYYFSGLRPYVNNIIKNQNGIATEEDINLVLAPIDVTKYEQSSSYYYYYYTTSSIVTKIAPSVAIPALGRLRLDKTKVIITYSKQTVL